MARMNGLLFFLTVSLLASLSAGDSDARIQSKLTPPHLRRPVVSNSSPDKSSRRTFVTAILVAEVAYLESLLSKQNKKKQKMKPTKPVKNHIHKHKKVRPHLPKHTPAYKAPTPTKEYVSKLDPFYMITAPDLSVKSESYDAPDAPAAEAYNAPVKSVVTEAAPISAPLPTYGAYQQYKAPITAKPSQRPAYQPSPEIKYGDFELYQPKGYLPPPPPKKQPPPAYKAPVAAPAFKAPVAAPAYKAPAVAPAYKAPAVAPAYEAPTPPPAYKASPAPVIVNKKPEPRPVTYRPSKGYLPPVKKAKTAYKSPVSAPAYKQPEPAPVTYRPSKGYLPPIRQTKPKYKAPAAPAYKVPPPPKYEAPIEPPKYEAPVPTTKAPAVETKYETPNLEAPVEAPAYKAPAYKAPAYKAPAYKAPAYKAPAYKAPAYKAPATKAPAASTSSYVTPAIPVYKPSPPKNKTLYKGSPNPHPHTFFHNAQAEKVHKGEWPPIYYNSLHDTDNRRRRL